MTLIRRLCFGNTFRKINKNIKFLNHLGGVIDIPPGFSAIISYFHKHHLNIA